MKIILAIVWGILSLVILVYFIKDMDSTVPEIEKYKALYHVKIIDTIYSCESVDVMTHNIKAVCLGRTYWLPKNTTWEKIVWTKEEY